MIYLHDATNYATFLRFKLFPKLASSPWPITVYFVLLSLLACAAAIALARNSGPRIADRAVRSTSAS